jgi:proteasome component ECM29
MSSSEADIAALDRVLTRLALTDDDRLEAILANLLPRLLGMLTVESSAVRSKLLTVLTHINSRVKPQDFIRLPCRELLSLFLCTFCFS